MVADTYDEAFAIGKRAFKVWYDHIQHLWRAHGKPLTRYPIPEDFQAAVDGGIVIVGTPGDVIAGLEREIGLGRQLRADALCLRRPVVRGIVALARPVRARGDAALHAEGIRRA
jgi:alkanesulfonate monooxygenase SsuD/methylene tetrahydromethanopterin reductase-like flavin-dependent oxidoreductase (luciferase family)